MALFHPCAACLHRLLDSHVQHLELGVVIFICIHLSFLLLVRGGLVLGRGWAGLIGSRIPLESLSKLTPSGHPPAAIFLAGDFPVSSKWKALAHGPVDRRPISAAPQMTASRSLTSDVVDASVIGIQSNTYSVFMRSKKTHTRFLQYTFASKMNVMPSAVLVSRSAWHVGDLRPGLLLRCTPIVWNNADLLDFTLPLDDDEVGGIHAWLQGSFDIFSRLAP